jgi:hypothetical protein
MILFQELGQCEGVVLGAGRGTCPIGDLGDLLGLGLNAKGTILATTAGGYTESVFRDLITNGKKHQLLNIDSFEDATPENERYTSPQGFMKSVREGKPMYNINFRNGYCFDKALQSMKGQDRWDVELYFSTGVLFTTNSAGTQLKGFNLGMFDANVFKFLSGTDTEFSRISLQFKDASEFTDKWVFIPYTVLGYNPLEIDDVIQANVVFNGQPVNADTDLSITLTDACNNSISYASLFDQVADWKVLVNGTSVTISTVSVSSNNEITLTITPALATSDVVKVSLNDIVSDTEMKYYKSNVATATV